MLPKFVRLYGFVAPSSPDSSGGGSGSVGDGHAPRLNFAMIYDEDQNNYSTARLNVAGKERALFHRNLTGNFRTYVRMAFPSMTKDAIARLWNEVKGLEDVFKFNIRVTATPLPTYFMAAGPTQVITLDIPEDFYGIEGSSTDLPPERQIELTECADSRDESKLPLIEQHPGIEQVLNDLFNKNLNERVLVWVKAKRSFDKDVLCKALLEKDLFKESDRPVITMAYYGSSMAHKGGVGLYGNDAAGCIFRKLIEAERAAFKRKKDISVVERGAHPGIPAANDEITCEDGVKRIIATKTLEHDGKVGENEARFPRGALYRIRDILTRLEAASTLAEVGPEKIFLVIVGSELLKEGATVKTKSHTLPLTAQILTLSEAARKNMDYSMLIQVAGRVQGRRRDQRKPLFFAPQGIINQIKKAFSLQQQTTQAVIGGQDTKKRPTELISAATIEGFEDVDASEPILKKKLMTVEVISAVRDTYVPTTPHTGARGAGTAAAGTLASRTGPGGRRPAQAARAAVGATAPLGARATEEGLLLGRDDPTAMQEHFTSMHNSVTHHFTSAKRDMLKDMLGACRSPEANLTEEVDEEGTMPQDFSSITRLLKLRRGAPDDEETHRFNLADRVWDELIKLAKAEHEGWIQRSKGRAVGAPIIVATQDDGQPCIRVMVDIPDWVFKARV